ncbi:putative leader peptide [Actinoallomurus purpureus]|uniref:putative leader peptide n=1 Tax=Actinoallomurus purpureus TaxID=478114 RepID=UPI0035588511
MSSPPPHRMMAVFTLRPPIILRRCYANPRRVLRPSVPPSRPGIPRTTANRDRAAAPVSDEGVARTYLIFPIDKVGKSPHSGLVIRNVPLTVRRHVDLRRQASALCAPPMPRR